MAFDSGGIANSSSTTQNTDQSQAYSLADQSTASRTGGQVYIGQGQGANITVADPVAEQLAKEMVTSALGVAGNSVASSSAITQKALDETFGLVTNLKQSDSTALLKTIEQVVIALAVAYLGYKYFSPHRAAA